MQGMNMDLVEEAKQAARQKQDKNALTASRMRTQQEEAQQIRNSDEVLFGGGAGALGNAA